MATHPNNLSREYETFVHTKTYDYGEFFRNINFAERILDTVGEHHLVQGLGKMFYHEYRENFPGRNTRKLAFEDAKILVKENRSPNYVTFRRHEGVLEAVREAVSTGYVWDFIIDVPWHGSFFFDDSQIYTFPFQHRFVVLYTGQAKHVFFDEFGKYDLLREDSDVNDQYRVNSSEDWVEYIAEEKGKDVQKARERVHAIVSSFDGDIPEGAAVNRLAKKEGLMREYRNADSILNQGALFTGNQHIADSNDSSDYQEDDKTENAIWLAFIDKAKKYPLHDEGAKKGSAHPQIYKESVIFEVEAPSNWLAIKGIKEVSHPRLENIEDCINNYESPMEMSRYLSRDDEWVIPEETGRLPLHYIEGVWDREDFPGAPHFMDIGSFTDLMEQKYPKRMPGGQTHDERGDVSRKELQELKKEFQKYDGLRECCNLIMQVDDTIQRGIKGLAETLNDISSYNREIKQLEKKEQELEAVINKEETRIDQVDNHIGKKMQRGEELQKEEKYSRKNLREAKDDKRSIEEDIESKKKHRRNRLKRLKNSLGNICGGINRRRSLFNNLRNKFLELNINFQPSSSNLKRLLKEIEEKGQEQAARSIATEIMNAHQKAGEKWEQNIHQTEQITEKMEQYIQKKSQDIKKLKTGPKEIYSILPTSELLKQEKERLENLLEEAWEEEINK